MKTKRVNELIYFYEDTFFNDILPFWTKFSIDHKNGGYNHYLDRDGTLLSTDKSVWLNSRQVWTYSYLYTHFGKKQEWLDIAKLGYDFLEKYCFDDAGRMFFQVTSDGNPLRKRRYWLTETFGIVGMAEYARASGEEKVLQKARDTFTLVVDLYNHPEKLEPKVIPESRPLFAHIGPMLLLTATQMLRDADPGQKGLYDDTTQRLYKDIMKYVVKPEKKALFEVVGADGEILDNVPMGRFICPGHGIEEGWFLMTEGIYRNDDSIIKNGLDILDWSLDLGWDKEYGGIYNSVDIKGFPADDSTYHMKYWWPHNEALYGLLLAHHVTKDEKYSAWYEKVHEWTFSHFPDDEFGEWYGYLNRDGSVALPVKGGDWKGSFHVTRMFMLGLELLNKMKV